MRTATSFLLLILAGCGGSSGDSCTTLASGQLASDDEPIQVNIEARLIVVDSTFLKDLGVSLPGMATIQNDNGGARGGEVRQGVDVGVDSDTIGGPDGALYMVPHNFNGALGYINLNFIRAVANNTRSSVDPPGPKCNKIAAADAIGLQNFPGGGDAGSLGSRDPMLAGNILYSQLSDTERDALIDALDDDATAVLINPPIIRLRSGQRSFTTIQDGEATLAQLDTAFQAAVQANGAPPTAFTGFTLDVTPSVDSGNIVLTIRPGTRVASAFRFVPFIVNQGGPGGTPADLEVVYIQVSTAMTDITVPDGQTLVLGGLFLDGEAEARPGLPLLADIPVIGGLFNHTLTDPEEQTLVIMITPRIID